jgi:hypothetical protein
MRCLYLCVGRTLNDIQALGWLLIFSAERTTRAFDRVRLRKTRLSFLTTALKSYELFFLRMKIKMTQVNLASMAALIRQTKKPFSAESSQAALIILGFDDNASYAPSSAP